VSNNAAWNIERLDQETNYGGRVVGTLLAHSDYAAMARALGAHSAWRSRRIFPRPLSGRSPTRPLWSMW
jgi:thiamine pyrophosphate-dependent acetolactate synthase large subunit-like protein